MREPTYEIKHLVKEVDDFLFKDKLVYKFDNVEEIYRLITKKINKYVINGKIKLALISKEREELSVIPCTFIIVLTTTSIYLKEDLEYFFSGRIDYEIFIRL